MGLRYKILDKFPDYRLGTDGSVWSRFKTAGTEWKQLRCTYRKKMGYCRVAFRNGEKYKYFTLSKLMLETFVGPKPSPKHHACHNDSNPRNNRLSNLRWDTPKGNCADKIKRGTNRGAVGTQYGNAKLDDDKVRDMRRRREAGETYQSIADLYGISIGRSFKVCNRQGWQHVV